VSISVCSPLSIYNEECKINFDINNQKRGRSNLLKYTQNILDKSSHDQLNLNSKEKIISISSDNIQTEKIDNYHGKEKDKIKNNSHEKSSQEFRLDEDNHDIYKNNIIKELESQLLEKENKIILQNKEIETITRKYKQIEFRNEKTKNKTNEEAWEIKFSRLTSDYDSLLRHFTKSETIREEQNKLIKSLQKEIEMLRNLNTISDKYEQELGNKKYINNITVTDTSKQKKKTKKILSKKIPKSQSKNKSTKAK
jgi:hypothetical protein